MAAGSTADAVSSWHMQEANPALRSANGQFGSKAVSIKLGAMGGIVALEYALRRHKGAMRTSAVTNFTAAGLFGASAARNETLK
jgi:hypothetical protein